MEAAPPVIVHSSQSLSAYRRVQWAFILTGVLVYLTFITCLTFFSTEERQPTVAAEEGLLPTGEHCLRRVCVFKCCPDWEGFVSSDDRVCAPDNSSDPETFMSVLTSRITTRGDALDHEGERDTSDGFVFINRCGDGTPSEALYNETFFAAGGSLIIDTLYVEQATSCFEFTLNSVLVVQGCISELNPSTISQTLEHLTLFCMCMSSICLVAVLVVYSCIPQLRNLQGKVLMCFVSSEIVFHVNFILPSLLPATHPLAPFLAQGSRLFLLFWLSWLTVMCYDIWSTFSRPLRPCRGRDHHLGKFLYYSLAGWGCPVFITLAHGWIYGNHYNDEYKARLAFIALEVYLNFIMFVATLANMRLHKIARSDSLHSEGSQRHGSSAKDGLWLYGRLCFMMGLDWLVFLVAAAAGSSDLTAVSFIVVESQGMFLFAFLLYNKRVVRLVLEKCRGIFK